MATDDRGLVRSLAGRVSLHEYVVDPDPFVQFRSWWDEAGGTGQRWSDAMVLSTVSAAGWPSARAVILRGFDRRGFRFFTDTRSSKARELSANERAALVFLWPALERQVRVCGRAEPLPEDEVDAFFATRPREANLAAAVAPQGEVVAGREVLERRLRELDAATVGPPGRPAGWGGYVVKPEMFEFWQGRRDYLHDRLRYRRNAAGWQIERLAP